ncbi:MAG TPA: CPBP family intramembrane glutamic endopeptidase [Pyrinomonadaceae bacterium]|nr:CPBP family intramembrane glutamic endopeptidase [Pyrinomonadaceae bacterium]
MEAANNLDFEQLQPAEPTPTPDDPPWNTWIAVLAWAMSVLFIIIFPAFFIVPYMASVKPQFENNQAMIEFAKTDPTMLLLQVIAIIPAHIATLVLSWYIVTKFRQFSFRETLGWSMNGMKWWHFVLILIGFFAIAASVTYFHPEADNEMLRLIQSSRAAVFVVAFMATVTAPLVEEVIYRGLLFSAFQRAAGALPAVLIVTGLFTAVHVPQYWPSTTTIALLLLLSLILTLIRFKTGNLLPCIVLHTIFNGFQSILLIIEPYLPKDIAPAETAGIISKIF